MTFYGDKSWLVSKHWPLPVCDASMIGILNGISKSWKFLNAKVRFLSIFSANIMDITSQHVSLLPNIFKCWEVHSLPSLLSYFWPTPRLGITEQKCGHCGHAYLLYTTADIHAGECRKMHGGKCYNLNLSVNEVALVKRGKKHDFGDWGAPTRSVLTRKR